MLSESPLPRQHCPTLWLIDLLLDLGLRCFEQAFVPEFQPCCILRQVGREFFVVTENDAALLTSDIKQGEPHSRK